MAAKFEIAKTKNDKFVFNLKATNGQVILTSQVYESRDTALTGIQSCKVNSASDAQFERKTASNGETFFNLKATNGQVIGKSETYKTVSV